MNLNEAIRKLRLSDNSVKAKAFDIINDGFRSMETDEIKANEIDNIIYGNDTLGNYKLKCIMKLIEFADNIELKG